jgi:serine/threonine protein kinase/tetratricopeptide (TPR) repeat protein
VVLKTEQPTRLRLGAFELNLRTGELRPLDPHSNHRKILLQEQPFRVLQILIERGGEIATREEIKKWLWPNDTVVDFDHNINVAIGTLRRAFGDSAGNPAYIETVARRGYRLMVPVETVEPLDSERQAPPEAGSPDADSDTPLQKAGLIGRRVSHFRVLEVIGGGGMGMVYRAEDIKLGRPVALKFLPEELANDPVSLKRFEREAQTASSLNHPNICTIFEIEEFEGQPLIVMELLDGETLRDRLAAAHMRKIPLDQLLEIALQTCDGLQAAHAKGIIHRDIKPANIFLTTHGPAKILDFGLAKLVEAEEPAESNAEEPTLTAPVPSSSQAFTTDDTNLTRTGMAMGTASYMSPEQIRKEKLDARTDLFSFGLVLYEMAAGQRAFPGDKATGVQEALLNRTPIPLHDLNPAVPPALEAVITRALIKDRTRRYQSAAEMRADLKLVPTPKKLRIRRIRKWLGVAAAALFLAGGAVATYRYLTRYQLSPTDTIVIADLTNQTSDAVLDDALNLALPVELAQTPFLQVLAQDKVRETMTQLNHPLDGKVTPEIAREVCLKTNSKAVVSSSIADAGNHFHIELTGINCQSGKTFAQASQDAPLRTDIVHALGVAGTQLRRKMGEPEQSLSTFNKPLEIATSSSPEALQLVARGFRSHFSPDMATTLSYYERATDLDPQFALAYASAGATDFGIGRFAQGVTAEKKAYDLRDRLTGQLRFLAETLYYSVGLGDLERSYPVYQEWIRTFPLDGVAHNNFAGCLFYLGQYDEAAKESREALRLMPLLGIGNYFNLIRATAYSGRLEEAKRIYEEAQIRKVDSPDLRRTLFLIAFLQHDDRAMDALLLQARQDSEAGILYDAQADVEAFRGRFSQVPAWLQKARRVLQKGPLPGLADNMQVIVAIEKSEVGQRDDSARWFKGLPDDKLDRVQKIDLALALARNGETDRALKLADEVDQEAPFDTLVQKFALPAIRAAVKLRENEAENAIEILRPAEPYDLAFVDSFDFMYPAYLRGLAYLQLGRSREAAEQFQKMIDHPAVVRINVIGALAHLQLGRAEVMMGEKPAARKAYQDFLTIWKDADPGIPIYRQAKAEYAKL